MRKTSLPISDLETPVLWVDLDQLECNIRTLADFYSRAGVHWRPHVKGIKVPAIIKKAIDSGAIGATCATVDEAEIMAHSGIRDILIANQIIGRNKIARVLHLPNLARVTVAVDSEYGIGELGTMAREMDKTVGVVVELDTGMQRTGTRPGQPAVELSKIVHGTPGLRFRGLMAWEGHTRAIADITLREREIIRSAKLLTDTADLCRNAGLPVEIVSGGGSGTCQVTAVQPGITEIQTGGAIYCDVKYRKLGVLTKPSLFLTSTVTSRPVPERIICDAGFKTLPGWATEPEPVGIHGVKKISLYAAHCSIICEAPDMTTRICDRIDFIVGYCDATIFLHEHLYGIRNDTIEVEWIIPKTAEKGSSE